MYICVVFVFPYKQYNKNNMYYSYKTTELTYYFT